MKKEIIILAKIVCLLICLCCVDKLISRFVIDYSEDEFKISMDQFHSQDNIDVLFLGSSHVFCGVNPNILSEKWEKDVYLAATPVQKPDTSYYLLKEAVELYHPKTVYLDMYYWVFRENSTDERTDYYLNYFYAVSDYLNSPYDRIRCILDGVPQEEWIHAFLPATRTSNRLFDIAYIEKNLKYDYASVQIDKGDKGFRGVENQKDGIELTNGLLLSSQRDGLWVELVNEDELDSISEKPIGDYAYKYLQKIIDLCSSNDIELILFCTPMTDFQVNELSNYDTYHNAVMDVATRNSIVFWDFNLANPQKVSYNEDYFLDTHHLNMDGAEAFSVQLADVYLDYQKQGEISEHYFCDSVNDKCEKDKSRLLGTLLKKNGTAYELQPVKTSDSVVVNYHIYISLKDVNDDAKELIEVNIDEENTFVLQDASNYILRVEAEVNGKSFSCNDIYLD